VVKHRVDVGELVHLVLEHREVERAGASPAGAGGTFAGQRLP
jgi:hypothetical protein